jgi:lysozyme
MISLRQPGRSPLPRAVARLLILALVATLTPLDLWASFPAGTPKLTKTAFGELLAHSGSDPQPYAFTGEPLDPNSGFQYHRARWMDPAAARFATLDPLDGRLRQPSTLHKYSYVASDPLNKLDPTGESFFVAGIAATLVVAAIAGIASLSADIGPGSTYLGLPGPIPPAGWYTERLVEFVKSWELYEAFPYDGDNNEIGNCTIGYGHLIHEGPCNDADYAAWAGGLTMLQADQLLRDDLLNRSLVHVRELVHVPLFQHQFDAIVDFVFNIGRGAPGVMNRGFYESTARRMINTRQLHRVPDAMLLFDQAGGTYSQGVVNRRNAEIRIWRLALYRR